MRSSVGGFNIQPGKHCYLCRKFGGMIYQSRKRKYRSRRERNAKAWRDFRAVLLFLLIALIIWIWKDRYEWMAWWKTLF